MKGKILELIHLGRDLGHSDPMMVGRGQRGSEVTYQVGRLSPRWEGRRVGWRGAWRVWVGVALVWVALSAPGVTEEALALELCGGQSKVLMRSVGITDNQIERLCRKANRVGSLLSLNVSKTRNELGYCRLTLVLGNHSTEYLNALVVSSAQGWFDSFRFNNIHPGGTGYASANSKILLDCDELNALKLTLLWPISIRIGDRSPGGGQLNRYRPHLRHPILAWKP